mmetsp:Transcript_59739/g.124845  ORF Transcript_59739/g.124845 Transcript_59739/m.124845 type:complete len:228 (-) Transcript_59739:22-705(-)
MYTGIRTQTNPLIQNSYLLGFNPLGTKCFYFDAATSIPFAWIDWSIIQGCMTTGSDQNNSVKGSGVFRIIKTLRILKLSRLLKVIKIFSILQERFGVTPSRLRVVKLLFGIFTAFHLFTCSYWRLKSETFVGHDEEDWMRLNSIEDPTDNAQLYLACTCSIFNVISGLAGGKSAAEQIFSVIVICIAAVCFGLVLGEMQEVYATSNSKIRAVEMHLESVMVFLDEHR